MYNPKVYVGSYGEYNAGRLTGGWVSLNECKDYATFLSKCRAMHRGEREPEYMIQDSEDFPDGIDCMEWLSEQDFNDVKARYKRYAKASSIGCNDNLSSSATNWQILITVNSTALSSQSMTVRTKHSRVSTWQD